MNTWSSKIAFTAGLWDEVREKLRHRQIMPAWVSEVLAMNYEQVQQLPDSRSEPGPWKPEFRVIEKSTYIAVAEQTCFMPSARKEAEDHVRLLAALKQAKGERVLLLSIASNNGVFRCFFEESTLELIHHEFVCGRLGGFPRWKDLMFSWRVIVLVMSILAAASLVTAPSLLCAIAIYAAALIFYFLILLVFGSGHAIEGAVLALILVILAGLLCGAYYRAIQKREQIKGHEHSTFVIRGLFVHAEMGGRACAGCLK